MGSADVAQTVLPQFDEAHHQRPRIHRTSGHVSSAVQGIEEFITIHARHAIDDLLTQCQGRIPIIEPPSFHIESLVTPTDTES